MTDFYEKWLSDFVDAQLPNGQIPRIIPTSTWGYTLEGGPAWEGAAIILPWNVYIYTGKQSILEDFYEMMKGYLESLIGVSENYLVTIGLGDWLPPYGGPEEFECPTVITSTAYFYYLCMLFSKISNILGKKENYVYYHSYAQKIQKKFIRTFYYSAKPSQTFYAAMIDTGLVMGKQFSDTAENLLNEIKKHGGHINCGLLGTKFVYRALARCGRADVALDMLLNTEYPSYGHFIKQGYTTLGESWKFENNSLNHAVHAHISAWFFNVLAGINPVEDSPGFKKILISPFITEQLSYVKASYLSRSGLISSEIQTEKHSYTIKVSIPEGCTAKMILPDKVLPMLKPGTFELHGAF